MTDSIYQRATQVDYGSSGGAQIYNIKSHNGSTAGLMLGDYLLKSTGPQIDAVCQVASRLVNCTASTLTISSALHSGRVVTLNRAAGIAVTLPAATGTGTKYDLLINTLLTSNTTTITTGAGDFLSGLVLAARQSSGLVTAYMLNGSSNHILTFNGTTQGGVMGDKISLIDVAANLWQCQVVMQTVGASASPVT